MLLRQTDNRNCAAVDARNASGSPCFHVYLRCHVVDTFFRKRLAFPFYASVTTLAFLPLASLLSFLRLSYSICLLALCHVIFQCSSEISFGRQKNFRQTFLFAVFASALRVSVNRNYLCNKHCSVNV